MGDRWVELRVHGVSGTPPGSMLDRPHVRQVGGDHESRYFRSQDAGGEELFGHDGQVLEAYHWGRLTSGSRFNALWLFLLPFGMVNAAHYMLPPAARRRRHLFFHATCDAFMRFVGILLTSMYAFAAGLIFVDLIGWRWASTNGLLNTLPPGLVLTAGVLLSVAAVLGLWFLARGYDESRLARWLARRRGPRGGARRTPETARETVASTGTETTEGDTPLANEMFYSGDSRAAELKDLHVAGALLVLAMMAVWAGDPDALDVARGAGVVPDLPSGSEWLDGPRTLLYAAVLWWPVALAVLFFGDPEGGTRTPETAHQRRISKRWSEVTRYAAPALLAASVAVLVLALAALASSPIAWADQARPVAFDVIANYLLFAGVIALLLVLVSNLLFVSVGGYRPPERGTPEWHFRPYAAGLAPATVTLTGTFIGVGLAAAVTTGVSSLLGLTEDARGDVLVGSTPMLDRVAYAWGLNAIFVPVLLLVYVGWSMRAEPRARRRERVARVYDVDGTSTLTAHWLGRVRRAVWSARLKNAIGWLFLVFATFGLFVSFVAAYELSGPCHDDSSQPCRTAGMFTFLSQPKHDLDTAGATPLEAASNMVGLVGAWVVLAVAGLLLLQGRKAFRTEERRRSLNVIWDVLAFWPHAVHPFSPRPYSKRCVHDLRGRVEWHLGRTRTDQPRDLVLCGHSQGSLISVATVLQLAPAQRDRVALVTFGSQLRVIFPRAFPAYVSYPVIRRLYDDLGGAWINLYRLTDPLAGPVLSWRHAPATGGGSDVDGQRGPTSYHFPAPDAWGAGWTPDAVVDEYDEHRTLKCGADWQLADPVPFADLNTGAVAELLGHSCYPRNPDWAACLDLVRATPPPPPPSVPVQPSPERLAAAGQAGEE